MGARAFLEIVTVEYPNPNSPTESDLAKLAVAAGWPADPAGLALVSALVRRRLPLQSDTASEAFRRIRSVDRPTPEDVDKILIDILSATA